MNKPIVKAAMLTLSAMIAVPAAAQRGDSRPPFPLAPDPGFFRGSNDECDFKPFACALTLIEQRETAAALPLLRRSAATGSGVAMRAMGLIYLRGEGDTPQDLAQAVRWFRAGAQLGDAESMYVLGMLYRRGFAVDADPAQARHWLERAAGHGYARASAALSSLN